MNFFSCSENNELDFTVNSERRKEIKSQINLKNTKGLCRKSMKIKNVLVKTSTRKTTSKPHHPTFH